MLKSRVLLLQLMQNCFPMLPNPLDSQGPEESRAPSEGAAAACPSTSSSEEPVNESVKAVRELSTHLYHSENLSTFIQLGVEDHYGYRVRFFCGGSLDSSNFSCLISKCL